MNTVITAIYSKGLAALDYLTYSDVAPRQQLQQGLAQLHSVANYRNAFLKHKARFQLMDALYVFQASRATDLRDHLFALLGLASDANDATLIPVYGSATIAENCLRYARHFLAKKNNLEVLYRAGLQGHKLLAPSWVPNWYGKQTDFGFEFAQGPWDPLRRPPRYNIARGSQMEIDLIPQFRALHAVLPVKGVVIDSVDAVTKRPSGGVASQAEDKDALLQQKRQFVKECATIASSLTARGYPTGENTTAALWKTLICCVTLERQAANDNVYSASYDAWKRCINNDLRDMEDMRHCQRTQQTFKQAHDAFNGDKLLGSTGNGYFGMFNKSTKSGDLIVALYGGEWPFVVRPLDTQLPSNRAQGDHQLVGQCYIHGMMEEGQFNITDPVHHPQWFNLGGPYELEEPFQPSTQIAVAPQTLPLQPSNQRIFHLHVPPTPLKARFIMLEETSSTFYDVDFITSALKNPPSWTTTGISPSILGTTGRRLALLARPAFGEVKSNIMSGSDTSPYDSSFRVAKLVSIDEEFNGTTHATVLGRANLNPFPSSMMSFAHVAQMKPQVIADEIANGLLGKVYGGLHQEREHVHTENLRKWHVDAAALNYELDGLFACGIEIKGQIGRWALT
jgi:hypothetical protein